MHLGHKLTSPIQPRHHAVPSSLLTPLTDPYCLGAIRLRQAGYYVFLERKVIFPSAPVF